MTSSLSPGDEWPGYYRGYRLQTNPDGNVWWQVYQGTDRLHFDPDPADFVEELLSLRRLGGRVRITEGNEVITREETGDDYRTIYVGTLELDGELVPQEAPEFSVPVAPTGLSPGDLWPSVYDGAKFSFSADGERVWWTNPATNQRHPVETTIPDDVQATLQAHKPNGGSFRITPWNDVITLVSTHPAPESVRTQFRELPRVVRNIIKLRKERGLEMLPIYVGHVDETPLEIGEARSLADSLSEQEREELEDWAASLGANAPTTEAAHTVSENADEDLEQEQEDVKPDSLPDDDPEDWYTG